MPSADPSNISEIIKIVVDLKPTMILDVGVGVGKYGLLFRDYLDGHWAGHAVHDPSTWTLNLIGIEVEPKYITPVHRYVYTALWMGNAYELLVQGAAQNCFDLVFMGDIIEHFTKEEGKVLIKAIKDKWLCEFGHILISTPNFQTSLNPNREPVFGNTFERHKCRWYAQEFRELGLKFKIIEGRLLTVLLSV